MKKILVRLEASMKSSMLSAAEADGWYLFRKESNFRKNEYLDFIPISVF